ncbi:hypothetical protein [Georhizobium profundi]|nr:hypothetical protein [Georhizobium profundi]
MTTAEQRFISTGRREASDSQLPLIVQKRQLEQSAEAISAKAAEAFKKTLVEELARAKGHKRKMVQR